LAVDDTIKCLGGDAGPGKSAEPKLTTWKLEKDYYFLNTKIFAVE
jgi:hypothetical protein